MGAEEPDGDASRLGCSERPVTDTKKAADYLGWDHHWDSPNTTVTAGYVLAVNSPDNSRYFSIYINDANYHPVLHSSSGKIGIDTNARL